MKARETGTVGPRARRLTWECDLVPFRDGAWWRYPVEFLDTYDRRLAAAGWELLASTEGLFPGDARWWVLRRGDAELSIDRDTGRVTIDTPGAGADPAVAAALRAISKPRRSEGGAYSQRDERIAAYRDGIRRLVAAGVPADVITPVQVLLATSWSSESQLRSDLRAAGFSGRGQWPRFKADALADPIPR